MSGEITVWSNDADFADTFFRGLFVECPPSFHRIEEFQIDRGWVADAETEGIFAGMLAGAQGWDPSHNVPDNIQQSLDEARRALDIANYRSSVAMSRRTLEAVRKFGYQRLLKREPANAKGRDLMMNDLIQEFRNQRPQPIPEHLLHVADSIRLIGNVPGAPRSGDRELPILTSRRRVRFLRSVPLSRPVLLENRYGSHAVLHPHDRHVW
jgi:hypothetical protein